MLAALLALALATAPPPTVCLDPGHGGRANPATEPIGPGSSSRKVMDGGGATGVATRQREADLALDVSLRLARGARRDGIRVVLTRTSSTGLSPGNVARARTCNRAGAALMLRIHADGSSDAATNGTHTLRPALRRGWTDDVHAASRRAAHARAAPPRRAARLPRPRDPGALRPHRLQLGGRPGRARRARASSRNPREDRLLASPAYRARAAAGLRDGVLAFLGR